jgi:hypothetical protein
MTEAEFVAGWLARSGLTADDLDKMGLHAAPCDCGEEGCEGWQMTRQQKDGEER